MSNNPKSGQKSNNSADQLSPFAYFARFSLYLCRWKQKHCLTQNWLVDPRLIIFYGVVTRLNYTNNKLTCRTFTAGPDYLAILIRVYPVTAVNHLISFTGLDLTARFSRKLLNWAKRNCVIRGRHFKNRSFFQDRAEVVYFFYSNVSKRKTDTL